MARYGIKCETPTCHRRRKLDAGERARLKAEGDVYGVRAGILCPPCVAAAIDDEDHFVLDMTVGEIMVQLAREDAPWRIVLDPQHEPSESTSNGV